MFYELLGCDFCYCGWFFGFFLIICMLFLLEVYGVFFCLGWSGSCYIGEVYMMSLFLFFRVILDILVNRKLMLDVDFCFWMFLEFLVE